MKRKIAVISGSKKNSNALCKQFCSLFGNLFDFIPFTNKEWSNISSKYDLLLISTYSIFTRQIGKIDLTDQNNVIIIDRTLSKKGYEQIKNLPSKENFLVVNDDRDSSIETISLLYELGVRDANLFPFFPGSSDVPSVDFAITPGEVDHVPSSVQTIIDVGERVVDINTLVEILVYFDLLNSETQAVLDSYAEKIMTRNHGFQDVLHGLIGTSNLLKETLDIVDDGVITYDRNGKINIFNKKAEEIFNIGSSKVRGEDIYSFLKNINVNNQLIEEEKSYYLMKVNGQSLIFNKKNIGTDGRPYGGVLTFKVAKQVENLEEKLRTQLKSKGHVAKYTFHDIKTKNKEMLKTIQRAKKMSHSDLSVLIIGESGTGKELFAHAIHNESPRSNFPFIAVNCSSLPENLLESELFGYEEGAFTGARKGGKPGLFEQAHKGTIFLDEIGDISPSLQTRLLRVVQQKEVLKIGGTNVLPVDVRIIAATNRYLLQRMKDGDFREDLYFRLNVLHFEVPSLRNRKEDIPYLIDYFLERRKISRILSQPVMKAFINHQWIGNVRELENTIEYLSIMSDEEVTIEDLPFLNDTTDNHTGLHYNETSLGNNILPVENVNIN